MTAERYLALAGEPARLREKLASLVPRPHAPPRLDRIFDSEDLVIFASPETPHLVLEEQKGVVVGRLYRGAVACEPVRQLTLSESRHAAWSRGRSLIEGKWGSFVAFVRDSGIVSTLRDPSGTVPAYASESDGLQLYFSDAELLEEIAPGAASLDEDFLRQWLTFPFLRTARTGARQVAELLPGTCRTSGPSNTSIAVIWSPWKSAGREQSLSDFDEAARRLREVALATVPVQLAGVDNPALELSGGLDSSIVAACLAASGCPFHAVTFATDLPDGDERAYAREVAGALDIALAEVGEDDLPLDLSPPPRTLRPPLSPVLQPLRRALERHARSNGTRDFVTGAGGDNLFCYLTTASPVLDAAADLGIAGALRTLRDVAALGESTIWMASRFALRKRFRRNRRPTWQPDERFLAPSAIADAPDPHPWLDHPRRAAAGKIEHVESLVRVHYFLEHHPSEERVHHPLLNQPLMELCLAIPSWLWTRGGRNRAVARAAFADLLPPSIIRRRSKGRLESMCVRAYATERNRLAEILLDGELARRGLVDRPRLEAYLRAGAQPPDHAYYRLFDLVSISLWLTSWRD